MILDIYNRYNQGVEIFFIKIVFQIVSKKSN